MLVADAAMLGRRTWTQRSHRHDGAAVFRHRAERCGPGGYLTRGDSDQLRMCDRLLRRARHVAPSDLRVRSEWGRRGRVAASLLHVAVEQAKWAVL